MKQRHILLCISILTGTVACGEKSPSYYSAPVAKEVSTAKDSPVSVASSADNIANTSPSKTQESAGETSTTNVEGVVLSSQDTSVPPTKVPAALSPMMSAAIETIEASQLTAAGKSKLKGPIQNLIQAVESGTAANVAEAQANLDKMLAGGGGFEIKISGSVGANGAKGSVNVGGANLVSAVKAANLLGVKKAVSDIIALAP